MSNWIPCSERLPNIGHAVLISCTNDFVTWNYAFTARYYPDKGWVQPVYGELPDGVSTELVIKDKVLAWMPLPEPYKAEEKEE